VTFSATDTEIRFKGRFPHLTRLYSLPKTHTYMYDNRTVAWKELTSDDETHRRRRQCILHANVRCRNLTFPLAFVEFGDRPSYQDTAVAFLRVTSPFVLIRMYGNWLQTENDKRLLLYHEASKYAESVRVVNLCSE